MFLSSSSPGYKSGMISNRDKYVIGVPSQGPHTLHFPWDLLLKPPLERYRTELTAKEGILSSLFNICTTPPPTQIIRTRP